MHGEQGIRPCRGNVCISGKSQRCQRRPVGDGTLLRNRLRRAPPPGGSMIRFHVHVTTQDLAGSIATYSLVFGPPALEKPDYAKWEPEGFPVIFAVSTRKGVSGIDHLGIKADSEAELAAMRAGLQAQGLRAHRAARRRVLLRARRQALGHRSERRAVGALRGQGLDRGVRGGRPAGGGRRLLRRGARRSATVARSEAGLSPPKRLSRLRRRRVRSGGAFRPSTLGPTRVAMRRGRPDQPR